MVDRYLFYQLTSWLLLAETAILAIEQVGIDSEACCNLINPTIDNVEPTLVYLFLA